MYDRPEKLPDRPKVGLSHQGAGTRGISVLLYRLELSHARWKFPV